MAIVSIHRAITKKVLLDFGFAPAAVDIALDANAAVDQKQGDDAAETNLHAMRGFFFASDPALGKVKVIVVPEGPSSILSMRTAGGGAPLGTGGRAASPAISLGRLQLAPDPLAPAMSQNYRLQTENEARDGVDQILKLAKADVVQAILLQQYKTALTRLGEALHTVQDRDFHHFEPWPFKDIPDSLKKSPSYMICHALRDTGYISKITVDEHQFVLGLATRASPEMYLGAEFFGPTGNQALMSQGFRGYGALATLSLGAAPGSGRQPMSAPSTHQMGADDVIRSCLATEGVADNAQATDDSKAFVREVKRELNDKGTPDAWDKFVHWNLGS